MVDNNNYNQQPDQSIPFTDTWQEATVGYMMTDYYFFLNCRMYLQAGWFHNPFVSEIVRMLFSVHDSLKNKKLVSKAELEGELSIKYVDRRTFNEYMVWVNRCYAAISVVGIEILSTELTGWIQNTKLRIALESAGRLYVDHRCTEAREKLTKDMQDIFASTFAPPKAASFKSVDEDFEKEQIRLQNCMTIGHPKFDESLRNGSMKAIPTGSSTEYIMDFKNLTTGSLAPGDNTLIIGPTNAGKTSLVSTVVAANLKMGKDILYISTEQSELDIKKKITQALQNLTIKEYYSRYSHEGVKGLQDVAYAEFDKGLTFISILDPEERYLEYVADLIRSEHEKRKAAKGKGYDMLIVDYPKMLGCKAMSHQKASQWEVITHVYNYMYSLSRHLNMHGFFPIQADRDGMKINNGGSQRLLDASDVSGAFNTTHGADNIITLNRSPQNEQLGVMHFYVAKSRFSKKAWVYTTVTAFDKSKTHGLDLPFSIHSHTKRSDADTEADRLIKTRKPTEESPTAGPILTLIHPVTAGFNAPSTFPSAEPLRQDGGPYKYEGELDHHLVDHIDDVDYQDGPDVL